jgi:hypothetical protein
VPRSTRQRHGVNGGGCACCITLHFPCAARGQGAAVGEGRQDRGSLPDRRRGNPPPDRNQLVLEGLYRLSHSLPIPVASVSGMLLHGHRLVRGSTLCSRPNTAQLKLRRLL